ncbi:MAG: protein kinase [Gemmataceae bacterium]|nr:protein kinase [Gemmataceae bacterium]
MTPEQAHPEDREKELDEVIASYLETRESGSLPDQRQWLARYPHLAAELAAFFADEERFDGLMSPLKVHPGTPRPGLTPRNGVRVLAPNGEVETPVPGRRFGDYELLEEIARGGMGVVFKARQLSLGRIVAVKMIRDAEWAAPEDVHRFRLEAEAVANLDHPNIVPIYEISAQGGQHYFSMKWVEGGTLAQALSDGRWPVGSAGQQVAADLLAQVARAVHYAHQCGILHRDLKPANILLSVASCPLPVVSEDRSSLSSLTTDNWQRTTAPMITDFGLAKRVSADDRLTQSGMAVGTPSYMAPEQAAPPRPVPGGRNPGLTVAADVYSLGAILYELLTGRPPFKGETLLDTLRQVLEQEPVPPRVLDPGIDRDLETICLKCLDKDPARRYPSAAALAEELDRFLAGEPIQARPVGSLGRLSRWCRRNPALALTTAAAGIALAAVTAVSLLLAFTEARHAEDQVQDARKLLREKEQTQAALAIANRKHAEAEQALRELERQRQEAERQRQLEERSFRQAHQAVNDFYTRLSDDLRPNQRDLQPLRKKLLENALGYYQRFLEQRAHDPTLKRELANAQSSVARITSETGPKADAVTAYQKALALYQELLTARPDDETLRYQIAATHYNLGVNLAALGQPKGALAAYDQARAGYELVLQSRPGNPQVRAGLADIHSGLGTLHRAAGRLKEAEDAFRQAAEERQRLADLDPQDRSRQGMLALCYNNLGVIQAERGNLDGALASYEKARNIRARLARDQPLNPYTQIALAASYRDIGLLHRRKNNPEPALEFLEKARAIRERAVQDNPSVIQFQTDLASSHQDVGLCLAGEKRYDEALACYEQSRAVLEKVVRIDPTAPYLRSDLAQAHFLIANEHAGARRREQAARAFEQARALQEKLVSDHPDNPEYRSRLGKTLNNFGLLRLNQQRLDDARPFARRAIEEQRQALARVPQSGAYRGTLTSHHRLLLEIELAAGRPAEAVATTLERRQLWPRDGNELYRVAVDLARALALVGKDRESLSPEQQAQRARYGDQVVETLRQAIAAGFGDLQRLREDAYLEPVRSRGDFQKLLADAGK